MMVTKSITIDLKDLSDAMAKRVDSGEFRTFAEYVRTLIKEDIKKED